MRLGFLVALLLIAAPRVALGQAGREKAMAPEARKHLERGLLYYEIQQYAEAIAEFKSGYTIDPQREFLYALGQAERQRGDYKSAITAYEAFLRTAPDAKRADLARRNIERCRAALAAAPPVRPPAGPASAAAPPPALPSSQPRVGMRDPWAVWRRDWLGHSLCVVGVTALVAGGLVFKSGRGAVDGAWATHDYADFSSRAGGMDRAYTRQQAGVGTMIAGGALILGGVVRYVVRGAARRERAAVSAAVAPQGAVLGLRGEF
ncbi:MAG: tetratricopeptide repeat protein [Gemmatimonadales bacterium]|jgi:tetratricopeptide (TPR) repeat protein|nr:tetratricopeptide repeat protein [Gemmatimonadales bacterium]